MFPFSSILSVSASPVRRNPSLGARCFKLYTFISTGEKRAVTICKGVD